MRILFVSWDGPQVDYLESLFIPIFRALNKFGYSFHVLQFTWGGEDVENKALVCKEAGVPYKAVKAKYGRLSIAKALNLVRGEHVIRRFATKHAIDVIMPRSTLPALMTLRATRNNRMPLIFDADGLPLDERVDFRGQSASTFAYRVLRDAEAEMVRCASLVLTRTEFASEVLRARGGAGVSSNKFRVVSNGRDPETFDIADSSTRRRVRDSLGIPAEAFVVVYAGSLGPQYRLDQMLLFFKLIQRQHPNAYFVVFTGSPELAQAKIASGQHDCDKIRILRVPPADMAAYLASADLGLAFRTPAFSMRAVAPIKLGEYLLCGVPVVASSGVGDTESLASNCVGIGVDESNNVELERAARWAAINVIPNRAEFSERCRHVGMTRFSLSNSVASYRDAFERLSA